jgi:hypothetical protein
MSRFSFHDGVPIWKNIDAEVLIPFIPISHTQIARRNRPVSLRIDPRALQPGSMRPETVSEAA